MTRRALVRLSTVAVGVADPEATARFLTDGLRFHAARLAEGGIALTCQGEYGTPPPQSSLVLVEASPAKVQTLTFDIGLDVDLDAYVERLCAAAIDVDRGSQELRVVDPDDIEVRLRQSRPSLAVDLPPDPVRPRRLGHVNLKVPDATRSMAFYREILGLALSEQIGDGMFFLRAGTEHHNLGLRGGAEVADVHHVAFEIAGWESHRLICDHLASLGHTVEFGPGRHGPGNNLFVYVRDPSSGLRLELYTDMAHIQDDEEYHPPRWASKDRSRTVNLWGPGPPASFLE